MYVSDILDHLKSQCLARTNEDQDAKLAETRKPWDQTDSIGQYFLKLDKLEEELDDIGIPWTVEIKIIAAVKQMYASGIFDPRNLRTWEKKPTADKTWVYLQAYFTELYEDERRFPGGARRRGFESAANIKEKPSSPSKSDTKRDKELMEQLSNLAMAAIYDKEHIQQMSNSNEDLLKVVHRISEQNTELIKQNSALIAKLGIGSEPTVPPKPTPKPAPKPPGAATAAAPACNPATKKKNFGCGICGRHKHTHECLELERNAEKHKPGWNSIFD